MRLHDAQDAGRFVSIGADRLHCRETGRGEPVVLVHGFGGSSFSWRHTLGPLAGAGYRVLAPDLLGFGLSDRPPHGDYRPSAQAALLAALLEKLGATPAHLVGHSLGALVVRWLASCRPAAATSLVLVAPAVGRHRRLPVWITRGRWYPLVLRLAMSAARPLAPWLLARAAGGSEHVTPEVLRGYLAPLARPGTLEVLVAMSRLAPEPLPPAGGHPTLVIVGERDVVVPPGHGRRLAATLGAVPVATVAGAGHLPQETHPPAFNRLLLDFLGRTALTQPPR